MCVSLKKAIGVIGARRIVKAISISPDAASSHVSARKYLFSDIGGACRYADK